MAVSRLVDWRSPPLAGLLDKLLRDMTTGRNVTFMTDGYGVSSSEEITAGAVQALDVRTRTEKSAEAQAARTKAKAEVFTPAWLVNHMNNRCDEDWFGRPDVFNVEVDKDGTHTWIGNGHSISFTGTPGWQAYVRTKRLEITCGEGPFVTTRYDAATFAERGLHRSDEIVLISNPDITATVLDDEKVLCEGEDGELETGTLAAFTRLHMHMDRVAYAFRYWSYGGTPLWDLPLVDHGFDQKGD